MLQHEPTLPPNPFSLVDSNTILSCLGLMDNNLLISSVESKYFESKLIVKGLTSPLPILSLST